MRVLSRLLPSRLEDGAASASLMPISPGAADSSLMPITDLAPPALGPDGHPAPDTASPARPMDLAGKPDLSGSGR